MRKNAASVAFATALALAGPIGPAEPASEAGGPPEVEGGERIALFEDTAFRRGFRLAYPSSSKGHAVEKVLAGEDPAAVPAWRLCQWATRISLAGASAARLPGGAIQYEDETKRVVHGGGAGGGPDLILDLRAGAEYRGHARAAGEPWPHLLIEQDASRSIPLDRLARLELEVDLRLASFADRTDGRADPGLHAAQLQLFFIVKEVAPGSLGDFLWFGVPFFDSRQEYPAPHRARDGGKDDATGKFIYTLDGREVLSKPLGRGERVAIRKDLLPSIRDALAYAVEHGFLERGDPGRYAVVNMNLGWEMPGAYDAAVEVRGLAVTAITAGTPGPRRGDGSSSSASPAARAAPTPHSQGLHGYIGYSAELPESRSEFSAGMGFYAAAWRLVDQPISDFQIGLPSAWITPDNSDNKDRPLAPEGTLARKWPERGPTWSSVFQTVEGGLGYWAGNHFRYGPPKFSMNATPQCYDYEVGSPGWSFFYSDEALPDDRLGIAQLSNRLLIPPDALPFAGDPSGEFLGYAYVALPFTEPTTGDPPTGDQAWTCFLSAENFKGPIAYYIPETWSKVGKLFDYPFIYGRGLDARPGEMGGGAMEINTVPRFDGRDAGGTVYSKIPRLRFPVDERGRSLLVQDVTYYSKAALYDAFKAWRDGGPACTGRLDEKGAWRPTLRSEPTRYRQAGSAIEGVERVFDNRVFEGNAWGLEWADGSPSPRGTFPQYFKQVGRAREVVAEAEVPEETGLLDQEFALADRGAPYTSPPGGAWTSPGPARGPFTADLVDGSRVTYWWYRFVDQPSFQQYRWGEEKKAKLQAFVERIHARWSIDRDYMAPPSFGKLVRLDPALIVTPPAGLEVGYVPIVTRQEAAPR